MQDDIFAHEPVVLTRLLAESEALGFQAGSERRTGALLQVLAASKPGGRLLEIGTGTGIGTAWLLSGMDAASTLDTVDNDAAVVAVARKHLGSDPRVRFHAADGADWLRDYAGAPFDVIFADAMPGKFSGPGAALRLLAPGGLYVIDDLLPQPDWSASERCRIEPLLREIEALSEFRCVRLAWSSGLAIVARRTT